MTRAPMVGPNRFVKGIYIIGGGGGGGGTLPNFGACFNNWITGKTSGAGGTYPDGDVWLPGGVYYVNPFDLTPGNGVHRAYDPSKPYNNWLRIRELDGPGTVTFDLRPESAATALGQTQTQAYNDGAHGGGFRNLGGSAGSFRLIFDGGFKFQNGATFFGAARSYTNGATSAGSDVFTASGLNANSSLLGKVITGWSIPAGTTITAILSSASVQMSAPATGTAPSNMYGHISAADRVIFHGTTHSNPVTEWRRQYDIIAGLRSLNSVGVNIPDDRSTSGPYSQAWGDSRFSDKGDTYPTGFRLEGATRTYILRADVGHLGDDGLFTGDGCARIVTVGTAFHHIDNNKDASWGSAYQGPGPAAWFHNDDWQLTGALADSAMYDCTLQGHGAEWVAENGHVRNLTVDRCWQGMSGAIGGDIGQNGYNMESSVKIGSNGPITRVSGHFYKGFSNGMDFVDGGSQIGVDVGNTTWHAIFEKYGGLASINATVAVPTGVAVGAGGLATGSRATAIDNFLASVDAPHQVFKSLYSASDLFAVLSDYGIILD